MRIDKLTTKFQEALADAQSLALGHDNAYIEPVHLLAAMLRQEDGPRALLERAGASAPGLLKAAEAAIKRLPQVQGHDQVQPSPELGRVLQATEKEAIQRGDLSPAQMRGAWAGELGQTQFLASSYLKFAVDYDGNGRRDLINSSADALASTANYLKGYGWQRGGSWEPGSANFNVLKQWNKADVYSRSAALFADKLVGKQ